jgi:hypothetical protein
LGGIRQVRRIGRFVNNLIDPPGGEAHVLLAYLFPKRVSTHSFQFSTDVLPDRKMRRAEEISFVILLRIDPPSQFSVPRDQHTGNLFELLCPDRTPHLRQLIILADMPTAGTPVVGHPSALNSPTDDALTS